MIALTNYSIKIEKYPKKLLWKQSCSLLYSRKNKPLMSRKNEKAVKIMIKTLYYEKQ